MSERHILIQKRLKLWGWEKASRHALLGDASFRRYERLSLGTKKAILMDAPPEHEDTRAFVNVARHLADMGYSAPAIWEQDTENGLLLLEDLGERTYTRLLKEQADAKFLYRLAIDFLVHLHNRPLEESAPSWLPVYDQSLLLNEVMLFPDWYMPAIYAKKLPKDVRENYKDIWQALFSHVCILPYTLVLRDFHVDNLMYLEKRPGLKACGLLDFQDATRGAMPYDLMSLLEDARRNIAPDFADSMLTYYHSHFPDRDHETFKRVYAILAASRHAKVIGIFTRLWRRDGKKRYLKHIPRVWKLLEKALQHSSLSSLAAWMETYMPAKDRKIPVDMKDAC